MFKINGIKFDVGIANLVRGVKREMKYDVVTEDGMRHSEVNALYPTYDLTLGSIKQTDYDALHAAINTYAQSLEITLPDGQRDITFAATVELGDDSLVFVESGGMRRWNGMTLSITGVAPIAR